MITIHTLPCHGSQVELDQLRLIQSNPTAARDFFGEAPSLKLQISVVVRDYNNNEVEVDVVHQYHYYYPTQLITYQNWFSISFLILETALINPFIIYCDLDLYDGL